MKNIFLVFILVFSFMVGIFTPSVFAVYYDYYGNRYDNYRDFQRDYLRNNTKKWTTQSMVDIATSREPKREVKKVSRAVPSSEPTGSTMFLAGTVLTPPACPVGWEQISMAGERRWGDHRDLTVVIRTCHTKAQCSVLELEKKAPNWEIEPDLCPLGWEEAALTKVRRKEGGRRYPAFIRTCYVCR